LDPRKPGIYKYKDLEFQYEPFYVGIGKTKGREFYHLHESYKLNYMTHKCCKIRKIKYETKNDPIIIKLFNGLSRDEAINLEIKFITTIGRSDLKNGPLTNQTDGGDGIINPSEDFKKKNGIKIKQAYVKKPELREAASIKSKELWKNENYRKSQYETRKKPDFIGRKKRYIIFFPDGHEEIIVGLNEFCNKYNLNKSSMSWVANGRIKHCKKFKCKKVEDIK
jgi:hypothetical protein